MTTSEAGIAITESVFARSVMAQVCDAIAAANLPRTKAGVRHALRVPALRALAAHPDLVSIAKTFLGTEPIPFRATLFDKSAGANWLVAWHQDTALPVSHRIADQSWGPWSTKHGVRYAIAPSSVLTTVVALRVHLDDSTETNGPLRVLPGTHLNGVLTHAEIQQMATVVAPVTCVAPAGSVVAMRPLIVHASSKAMDSQPRRVLHMEYAASLHLEGGIQLVQDSDGAAAV